MLGIQKTTRKLHKGLKYIGYACSLDILFLVVYGLITGYIIDPASFALSQVVATENITLSNLLGQPAFITFIGWLSLQLLSMYLLFSLFQGSSCYMTHRALARKVDYHIYIKRFMMATIPWFLMFIIYELTAWFRDYAVMQGANLAWLNIALDIYLIAIIFLAGIHYNIIIKKATFVEVFHKLRKDQKKLLPIAVILITLTLTLEFFVRAWPTQGTLWFVPYILVIGYFAWARGVWLAQ